jgi:hypothetical protein
LWWSLYVKQAPVPCTHVLTHVTRQAEVAAATQRLEKAGISQEDMRAALDPELIRKVRPLSAVFVISVKSHQFAMLDV